MFKSIENLSTLFTLLGSIFALIIILLNMFWKSYCSKKYGISKKYFFLENKYSILFYVLVILFFIPFATYSIVKFNDSIIASKKDINIIDWEYLIYVLLYLIVSSSSLFTYMHLNLYKKYYIKDIIIEFFLYFYVNVILFSTGLIAFFNIKDSICNTVRIFVLIVTLLSLYFAIHNIKRRKNEPITYLCILFSNLGGLYYSIYFLNFISIIVYDKTIICLSEDELVLNVLSTLIGIAINIVSIAYLIMKISIAKEYDKQVLISQINYKYNKKIPKELAVITEYQGKFLVVGYKEDKNKTIILNTKKYWLVNPENYTIGEKLYKNKVILNATTKKL